MGPTCPVGLGQPYVASCMGLVLAMVGLLLCRAFLSWNWDALFNCAAIKERIPIPTQGASSRSYIGYKSTAGTTIQRKVAPIQLGKLAPPEVLPFRGGGATRSVRHRQTVRPTQLRYALRREIRCR